MEDLDLLRRLSDAFGVSGFEGEVRDVIRGLIEPLADELRVDPLGNLIASKRGKSSFKLMLDAHMDEIGLMVSYIEEEGYLRFTPLGGWDERIIPAQAVTIQTRERRKVPGVIGSAPPHILKKEEQERPIRVDEMFIDIGASSRREVEEQGIRIGDAVVIHYPFAQLNETCVRGKALDDRAGCAVLIKVLEAVHDQELDFTLVCNFAVGEEVGLRGARTAAYQIEPDLAIAVEGTIGADMPGVAKHRQPVALGRGPALTVADRSIIVNRELLEALERTAKENNIPYQYKLPVYGGTDAGEIHLSRGGVRAAVVSVSCRYIHSPHTLMRLDDFAQTVKLIRAFIQSYRV
ncbi:MAG: M42 family metallopeptidase [Candidatus Acetothermia bacterium]|jgi:endoglucanase|nr:M42 family metallopeptidase [Candidatus Acetothermia bacterium]MDH7504951.1 M42 family metallopeptidase [Candidatus Acetothermia bacterium]